VEPESLAMMNQVKQGLGIRQKNIGSDVYTLELLPTIIGLKVTAKLTTLFAPVLGSMADSSESKPFIMPEEDATWSQAALLLVGQMDKVDVVDLIVVLLSSIKKNGQAVDIDQDFKGEYGDLLELVVFSLKENFGSFFTKMLKDKGLEIPILSKMMGEKVEEEKPLQS